MEHEHFDQLTRSVASGAETRRTVLRLLAGGVLGVVSARLGLDSVSAGNQKKSKRKRREERPVQDAVQAEGKGKNKKRRDKKRNQKRNQQPEAPPECDPFAPTLCGACEEPICISGDWACRSIGDTPCDNGGGVWEGECCPGQKQCPGYTECFAADDCCPGAVPPLCEPCEEVVCDGGSLHCRPKPAPVCSSCQQLTCENGEKWVCTDKPHEHCPFPNWVWDSNICRCVCAEGWVDCGVYWNGYRWVNKCICELRDGQNYCDEERGMCCSVEEGCDF
jgi:hypothetical protein